MNQANTRGAPTASRVNFIFIALALMAVVLLWLFLGRWGDQTPAGRPPADTQTRPLGQDAP